jgi:hypothetical protein
MAAVFQVDSAITLWFGYGDQISIHILAAGANECFHAIGGKGMPTIVEQWKRTLSPAELKEANKVQNFAKHARIDPHGEVRVRTEHGELLILDSILCQGQLFQEWTPLMQCFYGRFSFENAALVSRFVPLATRKYFREAAEVYQLEDGSRMDYLNQVLPTILAEGRPSAHDAPPA